ncbi:MAG: TonB-dependent receptor [Lautropia sp.]
MSRSALLTAAVLAGGSTACAYAQAPVELDAVVVEGHYDNAVGTSDAASQGTIRRELLESRPAQRPGEVLEFVPGVIVTQHSGDGKANQYFLRGFNLDHGTDFATSLDGVPLNMPTHGHGQGYTDLNFLIPELIDRIEYRKGPYFARGGDFASAGTADILYRRNLERPFGALTLGQRNYQRIVLGGSAVLGPRLPGVGSSPDLRAQDSALVPGGPTLLGAIELMHNDGPWTLGEHLRKVNGVATLSKGTRASGWSASLMAYDASWRSTDQIPQRAVDAGTIGRFDAVDPSDGGSTSRYNLSGEWHDRLANGTVKVSGYALRYSLGLYSNFTYALDRPATGDQFEQRDDRSVFGLKAARDWEHSLFGRESRTEIGLQIRHDRIRVGLFDTQQRVRIATTREDAVRQTGVGVYVENTLQWTRWFRSIVGLRADEARFDVTSRLPENSGNERADQVSPKLSLIFGPWSKTELFVNAGRGFHSNDARGTTATIDPRTGDPVLRVPGLVPSRGSEIGVRTEWIAGLQSSLALWRLTSDSELVYVGDAGTTEPNRPSKRTGVEWNNRWTPRSWLLVDADLAWTRARFSDADPAGDRIPGAVGRVASVAVTARDLGPWSASLQWRYLGPRALIEDNSVVASSTLLTNLRIGHRLNRDIDLSLDVFNLFDRKVNDIEYFYESQLAGEAAPVSDRHFHPAEPRTVRLTLRARF